MTYKNNELELHQLGLGCGGMIHDDQRKEYIATIHEALDSGVHHLNTGDFYGSGKNEMIIGEALKGQKRESTFISVKFGILAAPNGSMYGLDVRPATIKNYITYSLKRLNVDYIDLYQPARIDLGIPVEKTIGAIADLVKAGYVRHIGLSQVDAETIKRAHAVHPISFIEMEYSLFNRSIEKEIVPTARELGIGIVAFGALAHGLLSGTWSKNQTSAYASRIPLFADENIDNNLGLVEELRKIANEKQITVPQLALAWLSAQGNDFITLIGASRRATLHDSLQSVDVKLSAEDLKRIEQAIPESRIAGSSFPEVVYRNGVRSLQ